jgi:hypothetical protein
MPAVAGCQSKLPKSAALSVLKPKRPNVFFPPDTVPAWLRTIQKIEIWQFWSGITNDPVLGNPVYPESTVLIVGR